MQHFDRLLESVTERRYPRGSGPVRRIPAVLVAVMLLPGFAGAQLESLDEPQVIDHVPHGAVHLAVDPRGRFALVWEKRNVSSFAIEMFHEDGQSASGPFRIRDRDRATHDLQPGAVAVDGAGEYLVIWSAFKGGGSRDLKSLMRARFYDAEGRPSSAQIDVESTGNDTQLFLGAAARNRRGDSIMVWERRGPDPIGFLRGKAFNHRNRPVGRTMDLLEGFGFGHRVAIDDLGRFVVVWAEALPDGTPAVYFQRFGRKGVKLGKKRPVARGPELRLLAVANDPSGEFAIAWRQEDGIRARFYDPFGRPLTGVLHVSENVEDHVSGPAMARDRFGNTVILWDVFYEPCCSEIQRIFGRVYDRLGQPLGDALALAEGAVSSVGIDDDGNCVVNWLQIIDGNVFAVVQRFRLTCAPGYEARCP